MPDLATSEQQTAPTIEANLTQPFYTPVEIAFILKLHIDTIRRYIRTGDLKASKFRGMWRVHQEDLKTFINREFGANK